MPTVDDRTASALWEVKPADLCYLLATLERPDGRERMIEDINYVLALREDRIEGPAALDPDTRMLRERLYRVLNDTGRYRTVQSIVEGTRDLAAIDWPALKSVWRLGRAGVMMKIWGRLRSLPREEMIRRLREFMRKLGGPERAVAETGEWR